MDAFISHSSKDAAVAEEIERRLEQARLKSWLDRSEIRPGRLLRKELQSAIRASRAIVLLWSKAAARSRWVAAEILTGFHLNRFIVGCARDKTALPYFLQNTIYLNVRRGTDWVTPLRRAVREAPRAANEVPVPMGAERPALTVEIGRLAEAQAAIMERIGSDDLAGARTRQRALDVRMGAAERKWRFEAVILNLAGYHRKNAYMIKHWDAIMAGRPPSDRLLDAAERLFYESLFVNPRDYSALNGLGSILLYERELDASEFFIRRALALAARAGQDYPEARHDLQLVLALKARGSTTAVRRSHP